MKQLLLISLFSFSLFGCDQNIIGKITLNAKTTVVTPGGNKVVLQPGTYRTQIRPTSNGALVFIAQNAGSVQMKIPKISTDDGNIRISAKELGQSFDLIGKIYTKRIPFDEIVTVRCVYDIRPEYVCDYDRHGRYCRWIDVEIPGEQEERRIGERRTKFVQMDLLRSNQRLGTFSGSKELEEVLFSREIVSYCRRTGWSFSPDGHYAPF